MTWTKSFHVNLQNYLNSAHLSFSTTTNLIKNSITSYLYYSSRILIKILLSAYI